MSKPVQNEKGEWVIPATRRPDGTWRKEVVLKEGYVPQDEVGTFETRASKMKQTGPKKIPGLAPVAAPKPATQAKPVSQSPPASQPPGASKPKPPIETEVKSATKDLSDMKIESAQTAAVDPAAEKTKRLKGLRKKLREIEELVKRPSDQLNDEQREKLSKKSSIEEEIRLLESP